MHPAERATRRWVEDFVVRLTLCPFARREVESKRLHYAVSGARHPEALLEDLAAEMQRLLQNPDIETTLLIHPDVLSDFDQYNAFLDYADALLQDMHLEGILQVASFHPQYRFANTADNAAENYTNRSPFPMLHLLREDSLERAIASYADVELIPIRNIERMRELGVEQLQRLLRQCAE